MLVLYHCLLCRAYGIPVELGDDDDDDDLDTHQDEGEHRGDNGEGKGWGTLSQGRLFIF